jgi:hypothetical protein
MFKQIALALTLALMMAPVAAASDHPNLDAGTIRTQQQQIRSEAQARTGRYAKLSPKQQRELMHQQDRVMQLLGSDVANTTELSELDQVALFNSLEAIEAIVNNAEDERLVCERHKPVGTNRPRTVCKTAAQRAAARQASQDRVIERTQTCFKGSTDVNAGGCG